MLLCSISGLEEDNCLRNSPESNIFCASFQWQNWSAGANAACCRFFFILFSIRFHLKKYIKILCQRARSQKNLDSFSDIVKVRAAFLKNHPIEKFEFFFVFPARNLFKGLLREGPHAWSGRLRKAFNLLCVETRDCSSFFVSFFSKSGFLGPDSQLTSQQVLSSRNSFVF